MPYIMQNPDPQSFEFRADSEAVGHIGNITVGSLHNGCTVGWENSGLFVKYGDGTKWFISWSWFDYDPSVEKTYYGNGEIMLPLWHEEKRQADRAVRKLIVSLF